MAHNFICTTTEPVIETKKGKIRGYIMDGIYTFHGIKYADAKRFQMPVEVEPWEGVKEALSYGAVCPMYNPETIKGEIMVPHRYWVKSEHCQFLNVWSPDVKKGAKKAVLVWLHGGGFSDGSSIEQVCFDGTNLAMYHDVVVVTVNHRLNILGYLNLEDYSEKYKNSGNAGMADIEYALRWVHDNIENFGGDPENVTIFGQSGGGGKVSTLLQMPSVDGLFHKAMVISGVRPEGSKIMAPPENSDAHPLVDAMLAELGIAPDKIEEIETVSYSALAAAYLKVKDAVEAAGGYVGCSPLPNDYFVGHPEEVGFREHAQEIPMVVGSVFGEMAFNPGVAQKYEKTREEQIAIVRETFGDATEDIVAKYEAAYPGQNLIDILSLDCFTRTPTVNYVKKKASYGKAPVYNYLFNYEFPYQDGKRPWHCSDLPFFFHNTDKVMICNKPGVSDALEQKMSTLLTNFAKYGDPNHSSLPRWEPSTKESVNTMILDEKCEVRVNFDTEVINAVKPLIPNPFQRKRTADDIALR